MGVVMLDPDPDLDLDAQLLAQMREDFLSESKDILEGMGTLLAGLERGGDPDLIHRIFRSMHTLKGTAAFVGLESMRRLAHSMENIFSAVRSETLSVDAKLIDLAFSAVQALSTMRDDIVHGGDGELDVDALIRQLDAVVKSSGSTEAGGAPLPESIQGLRAALGDGDAPVVDSSPQDRAPRTGGRLWIRRGRRGVFRNDADSRSQRNFGSSEGVGRPESGGSP